MEAARYVPLDGPYHPACALITEADVLLPISKVREPSQLRDYNLSSFFVIPISILTSWDYPYTASFFARIPVIKSYEMLIWVLFGESSIWGFRRTLFVGEPYQNYHVCTGTHSHIAQFMTNFPKIVGSR